ncbi:MAG TPA: hypothetical protein VLW06_11410 [Terriglobales bacterium]|nr:hypothetical protein [Terriglobales bacterium]
MKLLKQLCWCTLAIFFCLPLSAQQEDINRYTLYTGFDYLLGPGRNLTERGLESDFGVTVRPWLGLGGDFSAVGDSVFTGAGTIKGTETVFSPPLQTIGVNPAQVQVPFRSTTYIFAAGPQFYLRKFERVTFFARPGFGGIHEAADLSLSPQLMFAFQDVLHIPIPNAHQTDTQWFIGCGGGFDLNVSRPLGIRFTTDWVNTHLFSNLLPPRQNYVRVSVGPTFRWGHLNTGQVR